MGSRPAVWSLEEPRGKRVSTPRACTIQRRIMPISIKTSRSSVSSPGRKPVHPPAASVGRPPAGPAAHRSESSSRKSPVTPTTAHATIESIDT